MSVMGMIEQFKALAPNERAVAKFIIENDDSRIPEPFKQGIAMPRPDG